MMKKRIILIVCIILIVGLMAILDKVLDILTIIDHFFNK